MVHRLARARLWLAVSLAATLAVMPVVGCGKAEAPASAAATQATGRAAAADKAATSPTASPVVAPASASPRASAATAKKPAVPVTVAKRPDPRGIEGAVAPPAPGARVAAATAPSATAKAPARADGKAPKAVAVKDSVDMGDLWRGESGTHVFRIKNTGTDILHIKRAKGS